MTTADIKRLGLILAVQAEIEGMKAENSYWASLGQSPDYYSQSFNDKAEEIRDIVNKHDDQL